MTYTITHINMADTVLKQKFSYDTEDINEARDMFDEDYFSEIISIKEG